jgi:hypothetical protein
MTDLTNARLAEELKRLADHLADELGWMRAVRRCRRCVALGRQPDMFDPQPDLFDR